MSLLSIPHGFVTPTASTIFLDEVSSALVCEHGDMSRGEPDALTTVPDARPGDLTPGRATPGDPNQANGSSYPVEAELNALTSGWVEYIVTDIPPPPAGHPPELTGANAAVPPLTQADGDPTDGVASCTLHVPLNDSDDDDI